MVVGDAPGRPDGARLSAPGLPFRADAEDLEDPDLLRVGDAQGLGAAAGRQEAVGLDERSDEPEGLPGRPAPFEGEDLGLFDRHDLFRDALHKGDVQVRLLAAGALADGQLVFVHLGIAGVEIGECLFDLRDVADDLPVVAEGKTSPVVVLSEIDHAPMDGGQISLFKRPARDDMDPAFAAAVRVRREHGTVDGGQPPDPDDRAALGRFSFRRPRSCGRRQNDPGRKHKPKHGTRLLFMPYSPEPDLLNGSALPSMNKVNRCRRGDGPEMH